MAYFSNGTEGYTYEDKYCIHCVNYKGEDDMCAVWDVHQTFNYDQCKDTSRGRVIKEMLEILIPSQDEHNEDSIKGDGMTNWDINNQEMLASGAYHRVARPGEWQPLETAPKDGTIIEIRCTYGVAPWYGLYHWVETELFGPKWAKVGDDSLGIADDDGSFSWRLYEGDSEAYIDPTGGAQDSQLIGVERLRLNMDYL